MYGQPPHTQYPRQHGQQSQQLARGYPSPQNYHPQQQGYPPQSGYPSQQHGYPPAQGYQSQQPQQLYGYPSTPSLTAGYPHPQQPGYPPQQQGYPPQQQQFGSVIPPTVSSYQSQAARWKNGFNAVDGSNSNGTTTSSMSRDLEAPLVNELCSSTGSSYPPRDVVQKLLRHLPSLDHDYLCQLLDNKLDDRLWQVQGKALSVVDALLKSDKAEAFKVHYYNQMHIIDGLCQSRKDLLRARAEKVASVLRTYVPPTTTSEDELVHVPQQSQQHRSLPPSSPVLMPLHEVDSLVVNDMPSSVKPGGLLPSVASPEASVSAFSFMASQIEPPQPERTALPNVDIFASTPTSGMHTPIIEPPHTERENQSERDPIHDAFEGLDNEEEGVDEENPLADFSLANSGTMGGSTEPVRFEANDKIREFLLEVEVPAGPMGIAFDRSISNMAVIERFLPLPTGQRGYLELHPALCIGCQLISINGMNMEDKDLDSICAIIGSSVGTYKVLKFKKIFRGGRIANPANLDVSYVPPREEAPANVQEDEFMTRLQGYSTQLDDIDRELDQLDLKEGDPRSVLAQIHGQVEKIQTQGIDGVILGAHPPQNADDIKAFRSALVKRTDVMTKRIQELASASLTAPSLSALAPSAPSAFNFVSEMKPHSLEVPTPPTSATSSSFSFLKQPPSEALSPHNCMQTNCNTTQRVDPLQNRTSAATNTVETQSAFGFIASTGIASPRITSSTSSPSTIVNTGTTVDKSAFSFIS